MTLGMADQDLPTRSASGFLLRWIAPRVEHRVDHTMRGIAHRVLLDRQAGIENAQLSTETGCGTLALGTPVKAALGGVVEGTGNSDSIRGCYSYGKWILLRHPNGLSTLYAHLSQVGVETGSSVPGGAVIGYSGFTGYATGPHLHFGVYASDGVKIVRLGDVTKKLTPCSNAIVPVSSFGAYLNPIDYLE